MEKRWRRTEGADERKKKKGEDEDGGEDERQLKAITSYATDETSPVSSSKTLFI